MRKRSRSNRAPDDPRARAIQLLSRREHGARELVRKLAARGLDPEAVEAAVNDLRREGWQSDRRYAEAIIRTRAGQGYGPLRVQQELSAAGVAEHDISAALAESDVDWESVATRWAAARLTPAEDAPGRARNWRRLAARGFDSDLVKRVLAD